jgi:hypothetical protein
MHPIRLAQEGFSGFDPLGLSRIGPARNSAADPPVQLWPDLPVEALDLILPGLDGEPDQFDVGEGPQVGEGERLVAAWCPLKIVPRGEVE